MIRTATRPLASTEPMQSAVELAHRRDRLELQSQPDLDDDSDRRAQIGRESPASLFQKEIPAIGAQLARLLEIRVARWQHESERREYSPANRNFRSGTRPLTISVASETGEFRFARTRLRRC